MFHDPRAIERVRQKMRTSDAVDEELRMPPLAELIERIETALAARSDQPR